eukprot:Gregarina_sp_Pseudo_9__1082@NODE_1704_length_1382_cov_44_925540_g1579_i0_p1_GENE_NODE_1704_length_1382_cov_44_925540_g1579_i0NODE_1704_length_1382_cov_44_925540_g1579_i0_p1_ORF_typecomplete_len359_score115_942Hacid_dh_C/PF02826_19/1_5e512Hacid_dh/PF00389_30/1_2e27Shikimate_DH/PF01488_20/0_00064AdoHcyase_NAD/PF00670_21/0_00022THF_DHG_CYH_C/PF02882_19/0_00028Rossmannlike/PF10727_9/0_002NAD_binding_2/PF03446_15/6_7e02NAD_binding_2/PF03446_15/0_0084Pyr_redox/PF00070_27/0_0041Glyoxalase_6/PF18029_1/0
MMDAVSDWINAKQAEQHKAERAPHAAVDTDLPFVPVPGPVAFFPASDVCDEFVEAVKKAGGTVAPEPNENTRGLVWLSSPSSAELVPVLEANPSIQWVQLPMAGVGPIIDTVRRAEVRPLIWTCAKGAFAEPVAEHALTLMLACLRLLKERCCARTWGDSETGFSLYGLKVLIVGAGGIGMELARLLEPFRVRTLFVRRHQAPVGSKTPVVPVENLDDVLPAADVVVLCAALTESNRHMMNVARLGLLKPSTVLINVGRGALVDTDALVEALRHHRIRAAGLDVTDPEPLPDGHPLWDMPNCIITPHSADTIDMCVPLLAERIHSNVRALLGRGSFKGLVDLERGY